MQDPEQPPEETEVSVTPTMLHIMGQQNLLQRTGYRANETELEE